MLQEIDFDFAAIDKLSLSQMPFVFFIDFLKNKMILLTEDELEKTNIKIDFPNYQNIDNLQFNNSNFKLNFKIENLETYKKGFNLVQENLRKGNSYLVNYTRQTPIDINYSLEEIFAHSKAKYKACIPEKIVFFSPETFIEIRNNKISTHPMKGTIDANIPNAKELLKANIKEKAEHYTVVDLLRNDLSIVANDVKVDEFQRIDFIQTQQKNLFAMSSEISGTLKPKFQNKIGTILNLLLPAGSILGAPKKKTLEIILEAEQYDRGFYSGICGYFDGKDLDSCVMIRFIEKQGENYVFKSGGGITHQSQLLDEYEEMKNKIYAPIY
ncbi:aminodeoxychorismate synthase component I [Soonwooa sp.]|uniref:aminodeoxychorismate synthase component I n=1 Tax=Soonwooa sp. TaxID=1938592 RepID=UPI0026021988|nr:aminodeoxychorismate synthase component I [Soonwooa sp.]